MRKKLSVVMCTYNGSHYLREQLDSILRQTVRVDEIIIQDDHSSDSTTTIVREYCREYPFIHLYVNDTQLGYNRNFMDALLKATGDYILISDQDDVWKNDKIACLLPEIEKGAAMVFHNSLLFKDDIQKPYASRYKETPVTDSAFLTIKPSLPGHEMIFRREALKYLSELREYDLSYDYTLTVICALLGGVRYVDRNLIYWRRHADAATFRALGKTESKWIGYWNAFRSLGNPSHRRRVRDYYRLLRVLPHQETDAGQIIRNMGTGSLWGIFRTCILCVRKSRTFFPGMKTGKAYLRAFFLPLFFVRDYGAFILMGRKA